MQKEEYQYQYHPNAYLKRRKNVVKGLKARTKILKVMTEMENEYEYEMTIKMISRLTGLSYFSSFHHLRLLEVEKILKREGKRPYKWKITGLGQKSIDEIDSDSGSAGGRLEGRDKEWGKKALPVLTVDIIIKKGDGYVFVKRKKSPFKGYWAIPGGIVEYGEITEESAKREAKEETGLDIKLLKLIGVYSDPLRDPRGHYVSVAYLAEAVSGELQTSVETEEVKVFKERPDKLAFDHDRIFNDALSYIK